MASRKRKISRNSSRNSSRQKSKRKIMRKKSHKRSQKAGWWGSKKENRQAEIATQWLREHPKQFGERLLYGFRYGENALANAGTNWRRKIEGNKLSNYGIKESELQGFLNNPNLR